jgi:hypothetical protein
MVIAGGVERAEPGVSLCPVTLYVFVLHKDCISGCTFLILVKKTLKFAIPTPNKKLISGLQNKRG